MRCNKLVVSTVIVLFVISSIIGLYLFNASKIIHIVYMSDAKYLPYMVVSIDSAIKNKNPKSNYNIHIIAKDFSNNDIELLKKIIHPKVSINIYKASEKKLDYTHLGRFQNFTISLQKLFISDYLPNINKVIYLDSDTLVQKDLTDLYNIDISNNYVGASKDGLMYQYPEHIREIGLEWRNYYFNSGVMLLNLNKIRKDNIVQKSIRYFNTHYEIFGDQDILNVVFKDKIIPISYLYNCNSTFFEEKDNKFLSAFYNEDVSPNNIETYKNAAILHFAGYKPWTPWYNHNYLKPLWQSYAEDVKIKYNITFK